MYCFFAVFKKSAHDAVKKWDCFVNKENVFLLVQKKFCRILSKMLKACQRKRVPEVYQPDLACRK